MRDIDRIITQARDRAFRVLRDEDLAQDFAIEIWKDFSSSKTIRHTGGYIRLRLRKALARKYRKKSSEFNTEELSEDDLESYQEHDNTFLTIDCSILNPFEKDIVNMLSNGYSVPIVASVFDVYPRTIYNQIRRLKEARMNNSFAPTKYITRPQPLPDSTYHPIKNRLVYAYMHPEGTPYYIGKGTIRRAYSNSHSVKLPEDPRDIHILAKDMSDPDARQAEMLLIHLHGRVDQKTGCLLNQTDGADGPASNSRLSKLRDDTFYADNPDFKLVQADGYYYSPTYPKSETTPKNLQLALKFPKIIPKEDPYYTKRMREKAEAEDRIEQLTKEMEIALEAHDFTEQLRLRNEYNILTMRFRYCA